MQRKTKSEIIDETAAAYRLHTRAVDAKGYCFYLLEDTDRKCGVGRCCDNPSDDWAGRVSYIYSRKTEIKLNIEELLKPEYLGHSVQFWRDIQSLHDSDRNWDDYGVSKLGAIAVTDLHKKWDHDETLVE
jgi:hypothetical protein